MSEDVMTGVVPGISLPTVQIVRGQKAVLEWRDHLVELSRRCGDDGAVNHLDYYLAHPVFACKIPTLVLNLREVDQPESAVLLYEYQIKGIGCRIFSSDVYRGGAMLLAPPAQQQQVAFAACATLMSQGAMLVQVTYRADEVPALPAGVKSPARWPRPSWAARLRSVSDYLPVEDTVDATLAHLGKTTRRNLRYYRRRAEAELGSVLVDRPTLTRDEFIAFNRCCAYPIADEDAATERYDLASYYDVFLGLRAANGDWLSMIGGVTGNGITRVEWQMNRADLPQYSLSTAMRQHLIEREVERGSTRLYFTGGTPHSIRNSMVSQTVVDLIAVPYAVPRMVSRQLNRIGAGNNRHIVGPMLADLSLRWHKW
jgi:hypothetical protein